MKVVLQTVFFIALLGHICLACEDQTSLGRASGSDSDGDSDSDTDSDSDADSDSDGDVGSLRGTVMAPSTEFPISEALVYLSNEDAPEIPDGVFCDECQDMTGKNWTLSNTDGTWQIDNIPEGDWNLIVRKGFFQRQRQVTVEPGGLADVPQELTTLPADNSADGLDQIPNYAVLMNMFDTAEDMLGKLGMGELDGSGTLNDGTQSFDLYEDEDGWASETVGLSSTLFQSQASLEHYHMVFFPCICNELNSNNYLDMLRQYVSNGGRIYSSCWATQWAERPFPDVIDFHGNDTAYNAGDMQSELGSEYQGWEGTGKIEDDNMRAWLDVMIAQDLLDTTGVGTLDLNNWPFVGGWTIIDDVSDTSYPGHGIEGADNPNSYVLPTTWASVSSPLTWSDWSGGEYDLGYEGHPLTITYDYDCGKVFYSTFQVVENSSSPKLRPQEAVLVYLFLEVGVCQGDYIIE